jgi:hypothetical protein
MNTTRPIPAWPYLVSNGRNIGYQPVIAPRFLLENGLAGLLTELSTSRGKVSGENEAFYSIVAAAPNDIRNVTVVFRSVLADKSFVGEGDGLLTDRSGRRVIFFEGIVLAGNLPNPVLSASVFTRVRSATLSVFPHFWHTRKSFVTIPSDFFLALPPASVRDIMHVTLLNTYNMT